MRSKGSNEEIIPKVIREMLSTWIDQDLRNRKEAHREIWAARKSLFASSCSSHEVLSAEVVSSRREIMTNTRKSRRNFGRKETGANIRGR
jgi:hypothetical protein